MHRWAGFKDACAVHRTHKVSRCSSTDIMVVNIAIVFMRTKTHKKMEGG